MKSNLRRKGIKDVGVESETLYLHGLYFIYTPSIYSHSSLSQISFNRSTRSRKV